MSNEQQLSEELSKAGFDDAVLMDALRARMRLGLPSFTLAPNKQFDYETIDYILHFRRRNYIGDYSIDFFEATYNKQPEIIHSIIDDIDTGQLELRMAALNWLTLPNDEVSEKETCEVLGLLWQLRESSGIDGFHIQQSLCLKYWKDTPFDSPELKERRKQFQRSRKFGKDDNGLFNAYLCYYELSGIRQGLKDSLRRKGFNLEQELDTALSTNQPYFEINSYRNCEEGLMHYRLPVKRKENYDFILPEYTATLIKLPPTWVGFAEGIDIPQLDSEMSAINWSDFDSCYIEVEKGVHQHSCEVAEIIRQLLEELPKNPLGKIVSAVLQIKYWITSPDFYPLIDPSVFAYIRTLPYSALDFTLETHPDVACNLLCGRPVYLGPEQGGQGEVGLWRKREFKDGDDYLPSLITVHSLTPAQLKNLVQHIPAPENELEALFPNLLIGSRGKVKLNTGERISVEFKADEHSLTFTNSKGQPFHLNLNIDGSNSHKPKINFRPFLDEQSVKGTSMGFFKRKRGI